MKKIASIALAIAALAGMRSADAGLVVDMDPGTAGIQGNIGELTHSVVHNITVDVYFDSTGDPLPFQVNSVGGDINWRILSGGANVTNPTNLTAGALASSASLPAFGNYDLVNGGAPSAALVNGATLGNAGLGTLAGFGGNVGGGGYTDVGGVGGWNNTMSPPGPGLVHLFSATFQVQNTAGNLRSTIEFQASGIINPAGSIRGNVGTLQQGGALFQQNNAAAAGATFTPGSISLGSVTVVPEPSSLAALGFLCVGAVMRRRRS